MSNLLTGTVEAAANLRVFKDVAQQRGDCKLAQEAVVSGGGWQALERNAGI